ncbi:glycosyltransferase family 4 protein [Saccharopolyspora tripterygii]
MRILLRGPVDPWSGYGRDVLGLTTAMLDMGVDVSLWPLSVAPGLPEQIARLLSRPVEPPYDCLLWYAPPDQIVPWSMYGWATTQLGWTMWERAPFTSANLPWWDDDDPDLQRGRVWSQRYRDRDAPAAGWLDALVVTCPMNVAAFEHVERHLPIEVIPPGVDFENYPLATRPDRGPVRYGWVGVPSQRKNLPALLDAWTRFREEHPVFDAHLEIKTTGLGAGVVEASRIPDVTVYRDTWPTAKLREWYSSLDALVSVSRGEGMNKPAVEAMATGAPVIAPSWGGHENWLHPDLGYPVDYRLTESPFEAGTYDCEPDPEDLLRALVAAADDPERRRRKGHAAANFVRSALTWTGAAERVLQLAARHL